MSRPARKKWPRSWKLCFEYLISKKVLQLWEQFGPEFVSNFLLSFTRITTSTAFHLVCLRRRHMVRTLKRFMKKKHS